jgi:hypothetical protein
MTAVDLAAHLRQLTAERLDAVEAGLGGNAIYMRELDAELAATRTAYVMQAVREIATLRAELAAAGSGGPSSDKRPG